MKSINDCIIEYKKQIQNGDIKIAYRKIMEFMMDLRIYFKNKYSECFVSGSLYLGYMDMTYFSFIPESFKKRKLKIAIVFKHDTVGFEVWLAAANKVIQNEYWKCFNQSKWEKFRLPLSTKGNDSILEHIITENPDFSNTNALIQQIEENTLLFIKDIENFFSKEKL